MFIHVHRLLTAPSVEDERAALRNKILYYVLLTLLPVVSLIAFLNRNSPRLYSNLLIWSVCIMCLYLIRRSHTQAASIIFLCLTWSAVTFGIALTGGARSGNYIHYVALIILAATLLSERWVVAVASASILATLAFIFAETRGVEFEVNQTLTSIFLGRFINFLAVSINIVLVNRVFQRTMRRLDNSQRQYRTLFESATVPMITIDSACRVQLINQAAATILQGQIEHFIGQPIEQLVPPKNAPYFVQRVQRVLDTGQGESFEDLLHIRQQEYRFLATFQPIFDENGKPAAVQLIAHDITAHKLAEERERELALAQAKDQHTRDLLSNISHDLKTPLSIIHTDLYSLSIVKDPQVHRTMVERIQQQTKLLDRFIQDILMLAGLENMHELKRRATNINETLTGAIQQLLPVAEHKQIRLNAQLVAEVRPILADDEQLRHAFVNLIENALTYTPNGGEVMVRTSVPAPAHLVVEIVDTGIGIDEADLPYIFERFYRAEKVRTREKAGSGLGLAIVKRVLDMHQYVIEVQSVVGEGTTFRVMLPLSSG